MNVNFSAWSIHRPTPAILLFFLATVAGMIGFRALQIAKMPDFDFPGIIVDVQLPGATPSQLETEVTRKIEDATARTACYDNIPLGDPATAAVRIGAHSLAAISPAEVREMASKASGASCRARIARRRASST